MITKNDIHQATYECVARANRIFGVSIYLSSISWFARGRAIGKAGFDAMRALYVKYNEAAFNANSEDMLKDTVPHEVAHLVVYAMKFSGRPILGGPHGHTWKQVCKALGGNPKRTTDAYNGVDLNARRSRQWLYRVNSGREIWVSTKSHNLIQRGRNYSFRDTKEGITRDHCTFQQRLAA